MKSYFTVKEVSEIKGVTTKAVYMAIRSGRLQSYRDGGIIKVLKDDLEKYEAMKWDRKLTVFDGETVYSDKKGLISVDRAADMIEVSKQKLYYAIRQGTLRASRKGTLYVIDVKDLFKYKESLLSKNFTKNRFLYG